MAQMETLELFVSTTCPGLERTTTIVQEWHATKSLLILPTLCHCAIQPSWYVLLPNIFLLVLQTKSLKLTGSISQLVRALQLPVAPPRAPPPDLHIRLRAPDVPCPPRPEQDRVRLRCPITISHVVWLLTRGYRQFHGHLLEVRTDRGKAQSVHKFMLRLHGGMMFTLYSRHGRPVADRVSRSPCSSAIRANSLAVHQSSKAF